MYQNIFLLLIFSFAANCFANAPSTYSQLAVDLQKVSRAHLMEWVSGLVKVAAPSRMVGKPGHDKASAYIQDSIKAADSKGIGKLEVVSVPVEAESIKKFYQKDFDEKLEGKVSKSHPEYQKWLKFTLSMQNLADSKKSYPVQNIIWEKTGLKTDKMLVVSAHYDTISHDKNSLIVKENESMPGANYNASGVAVALGLIKAVSQMDLNYTLRVVFLDWQGIGFHGSEVYARELKNSGKDIMGVVNLEMLGQDTSFFDKTKKNGNMSVYLRNEDSEIRWVKKLTKHGSKVTQKVSFEIKPNNFENSDNFRFNEQGFLSATFSQNWEEDFNPKFYQTAQDTPETLNQDTLWHSYQYVGGAVIGTLLDLTK